MRTTLTTLAIVIISLLGNINNVNAKETFFKNNEVNAAGQIIKTTISVGEDDKIISFSKQIEYIYNEEGSLSERIFSKWDSIQACWIPTEKFEYKKNEEGNIMVSAHLNYNESKKRWES